MPYKKSDSAHFDGYDAANTVFTEMVRLHPEPKERVRLRKRAKGYDVVVYGWHEEKK